MDMHFSPALTGLTVAANDGPSSRFQSSRAAIYRWNGGRSRFEIYRAERVSLTSTLFGGGDWHWRLSDAEGLILLDTGGYPSERKCREAIAVLKENAAFASVSQAG